MIVSVAAREISVDVAGVAVSSELHGIFTFKEEQDFGKSPHVSHTRMSPLVPVGSLELLLSGSPGSRSDGCNFIIMTGVSFK